MICQAKIKYLDISIDRHHDVFRLEVKMNYGQAVQVFKTFGYPNGKISSPGKRRLFFCLSIGAGRSQRYIPLFSFPLNIFYHTMNQQTLSFTFEIKNQIITER